MAIDEQKMEEAVGKVFGELGVAVTGPLVVLGDRLGLWAALAEAGPMTPHELASSTGTVERYVREYPDQWYCFYPFWDDPSRKELTRAAAR